MAGARPDKLHKLTTRLAKSHEAVVVEDLNVTDMTASAKGSGARRGCPPSRLLMQPGHRRRPRAIPGPAPKLRPHPRPPPEIRRQRSPLAPGRDTYSPRSPPSAGASPNRGPRLPAPRSNGENGPLFVGQIHRVRRRHMSFIEASGVIARAHRKNRTHPVTLPPVRGPPPYVARWI